MAVIGLDEGFGDHGVARTNLPVAWRANNSFNGYLDTTLTRVTASSFVATASAGTTTIRVAKFSTQTGALEPTFGFGGIAATDVPGFSQHGVAVAVDSTGGVVLGATSAPNASHPTTGFATVRFRADGTLDPSHGTGGVSIVSPASAHGTVERIAFQTDGKVLLGVDQRFGDPTSTEHELAVIRLNPNGTLDSSFGSGGLASIPFPQRTADKLVAIRELSSGAIVSVLVAGSEDYRTRFVVVEHAATGALVRTTDFITLPMRSCFGHCAAIDRLGRVSFAGDRFTHYGDCCGVSFWRTAVARYLVSGEPDLSFSGDGFADGAVAEGSDPAPVTNALRLGDDGGPIVSLYGVSSVTSTEHLQWEGAYRLLSDGTPDVSFGDNGAALVRRASTDDRPYLGDMLPHENGDITLANGYNTDFGVGDPTCWFICVELRRLTTSSEPPPPLPPTKHLLALGDSVAAGEGLGTSDGSNNNNPNAFPAVLATAKRWSYQNIAIGGACTGTRDRGADPFTPTGDGKCSKSILSDQLPKIGRTPNTIVLQVGANDIAFSSCFYALIRAQDDDPCSGQVFRLRLKALRNNLSRVLAQLKSRFPTAKIVVGQYYNPLPGPSDPVCAIGSIGTFDNLRALSNALSFGTINQLLAKEQAALFAHAQRIIKRLNKALAQTAKRARVATTAVPNFAGHDLCRSYPGSTGVPWVFAPELHATLSVSAKLATQTFHTDLEPLSLYRCAQPCGPVASNIDHQRFGTKGILSGTLMFSMRPNEVPHPTRDGQAVLAWTFLNAGA